MSQSAFQFHCTYLTARLVRNVSRITLAAALFGALLAFRPAHAYPEGDGSIFNVPGEGPPYVSRLHPRYWPPMPERKSYKGAGPYRLKSAPSADYDAPAPYRKKPRSYVHDEAIPEVETYERTRRRNYADRRAEDRDYHERDFDEPDYEKSYERGHDEDATGVGRGFSRLFPKAESYSSGDSVSFKALRALGRAMHEEFAPDDPAGDSEIPSGYTFLGQFIDHDLTLDTTTDLGRKIKGDFELLNDRTPDLDLDSVYGGGPKRTPHLYRLPYIRIGHAISESDYGARHDLFRTKASYYYGPSGGEAVALLGDPRNDENTIIAQLHAAFVAFHNRTADILVEQEFGHDRRRFCKSRSHCDTHELAEALPDEVRAKIFGAAQDHVIHYYHRLITEDFLPRVIGPRHTASLLKSGRDFYHPDGFRDDHGRLIEIGIPVEFAVAAFRYGHSQVREIYTLRDGVEVNLLSDGRGGGPRAFEPVTPEHMIDWRYFFEIDRKRPHGFNHARLLDPAIVKSLHQLNISRAVERNDVGSLAARNLARSKTQLLPSGQQVARIVLPALEARGLLGKGGKSYGRGHDGALWRVYLLPPDERTAYFLGDGETPLWYYILQEASVFGTPTHLRITPGDAYDRREVSGEYDDRLFRPASTRTPYKRFGRATERYGYESAGGHRLGPVGAAIVGEVLTGLIEHYREKTGKGLDFKPYIRGSESVLTGSQGKSSERSYTMRDFLIDAGAVKAYD